MQKTCIIGNVGTGAIVRQSERGTFLSFSIAVNEKWKRQGEEVKETTWYNCNYSVAEGSKLHESLISGTKVYIEGRLKPKIYDDQQRGASIDMVLYVNELKLLSSKKDDAD